MARVLVIGAAGATLLAAMLSSGPPVAKNPPESDSTSRPVLPAREAEAAPAAPIREDPQPLDAGDPIEPLVSIDALLDELNADTDPGFAEIDREKFKAELLADRALRDYFSRAP